MSLSLFDLAGKTAIVTGSGRGLGRAIAEGLAAAGARLVLCGRTRPGLEETAAAIARAGGAAHVIPFDALRRADCERLVAEAVAHFGGLDIMVVNHGVGGAKPAEEVDESEWDTIVDINLKSAFNCAQAAGRHWLAARQPGSIVLISSTASTMAFDGLVAYGAAKGGVDQMCRQLAAEWADRGIRVNAVAPGYMTSAMRGRAEFYQDPAIQDRIRTRTPQQRAGAPEELVGPVLFFASAASSFVTGHVMPVDGGYCIV
jgi:NAD(P)-dependent dehydrogenase (short-subunit alcohol dehydrogenase family)